MQMATESVIILHLGHFRHELYRDGSIILVYFVVSLKVWLHKIPLLPSKI